MPQGPPPHRSLLSVRSHSKGARGPSGVFASLQGLLWPDFSGPHNSLRSPKGYCLRGEPLRPPEAERIHEESLLKLGEVWGGGDRERLSQKPIMSLILSSKSAVINVTENEASLLWTVSSSTDHELPHAFW